MRALCVHDKGEGVIFAVITRESSGDALAVSHSDSNFRPLAGILSHVGAHSPDPSSPVFTFEAYQGIGTNPLRLPLTYPSKNQQVSH
jgi:hypothetical protein